MKSRLHVDGTGIQKVMKVSMRYAARGCIILSGRNYGSDTRGIKRYSSHSNVAPAARCRIRCDGYRGKVARRSACAPRAAGNLVVTSTP